MALIYAGIDEAGYGPLLGPLCVGMCVLRVEGWKDGEAAPDLWKTLRRAVARELKGRGKRIVVADSKKLKLANLRGGEKGAHPLTHLERAALCFLSAGGALPGSDAELFDVLGLRLERREWYAGEAAALPVAHEGPALKIDANLLKVALGKAGVGVSALRCFALCEGAFNDVVRETGSKAETTLSAVSGHVRALLSSLEKVERAGEAGEGHSVRIVCDRLGGRTRYQEALAARLGGASVEVIEETEAWSRYRVGWAGSDVTISFMPEAEDRHMPVALASIIAKYSRELAMARFNRYWCGRAPELRPTAGYTTDARRWLADADGVVTREERRVMVRLA